MKYKILIVAGTMNVGGIENQLMHLLRMADKEKYQIDFTTTVSEPFYRDEIENLGQPMHRMFRAINRILNEFEDVKAIYPIHMNPLVRKTAEEELGDNSKIRIIEPLDVLDFHNFMKQSYLILTDSGGIQEEAPSLGKPVLVMRDTTERPEGIAAGTLKLTGTEEETIYGEFKKLLTDTEEYERMSKASNPYGDGFASKRIADIIERDL